MFGFGFSSKKILTAILCLGWLAGCSSSGALPQTSLPLPENDPITVSSPDSAGFVVVTGATSAVPESATLVITVADSSASLGLKNLLYGLVDTAQASACSSGLPKCPTLNGSNQCQYPANSDGSFSLTVPASLTSSITVSYLDVSTCIQVDAYTKDVEAGIVSLDLDVSSVSYNGELGLAYLLGTDAGDEMTLKTYDLTTNEIVGYDLSTPSDRPRRVTLFQSSSGEYYAVIESSEKTMIGPVGADGSISIDNFATLVDLTGTAVKARFMMARNTTYSSYDTCVSTSIFESGDNAEMTRLFFSFNETLYVLEFEDNHLDVDPSLINSAGDLMPRAVSISASAALSDSATGLSADAYISEIMLLQDVGGSTAMLVRVDGDTAEENRYEQLLFPNFNDFCQSSITFSDQTDYDLYLGTAVRPFYRNFRTYHTDGSGQQSVSLLFIKADEGVFQIVDVGSSELSCSVDDNIIYFSSAAETDDGECALVATSRTLEDFDVTDVEKAFMLFSDSEHAEIFFVGSNNGGSQFVTSSGDNVFETDATPISVISPVLVGYLEDTNQMIVVDSGVSGDGLSNAVYYDLATEPALW